MVSELKVYTFTSVKFIGYAFFEANFSIPAIEKEPSVTITKLLYTASLITKSFPKAPVITSSAITKTITAKDSEPRIDFSFQSLLSLNISFQLILQI